MEVKILKLDEFNGSIGKALRVTMALTSYKPLRQGDRIVNLEDIYVDDGNGGADPLVTSNTRTTPAFAQDSSLMSTIQPVELGRLLKVNDTVQFEPTNIWGASVKSPSTGEESVYVNAKGSFTLTSYQLARAFAQAPATSAPAATKRAPTKGKLSLGSKKPTAEAPAEEIEASEEAQEAGPKGLDF